MAFLAASPHATEHLINRGIQARGMNFAYPAVGETVVESVDGTVERRL